MKQQTPEKEREIRNIRRDLQKAYQEQADEVSTHKAASERIETKIKTLRGRLKELDAKAVENAEPPKKKHAVKKCCNGACGKTLDYSKDVYRNGAARYCSMACLTNDMLQLGEQDDI